MSTATITDATARNDDVVIADAVRSPLGTCRAGGTIAGMSPGVLLAQSASALLERVPIEPAAVTKVLMAGGPGFDNLARQACSIIGVSAPPRGDAACAAPGSIVRTAARAIGRRDVVLVLATAAPWPQPPLLTSRGLREAELLASRWGLDREELDTYARQSRQRAREVADMGEFGPEIIPAVAWTTRSCKVVTADETIGDAVAPGFPQPGRHLHAGNISHPAVGAAVTILMGSERALELGIRPRARIVALAESHGPGPDGCGPVDASRLVFDHTGLDPDDLDHYEISEVYSSIPLAWSREFNADMNRFNPRGGSIGLGRPGPAAGLRSLATTLSALAATGGRLAIQASEGRGNTGSAFLIEYLPRACCSRDVRRADPGASATAPAATARGRHDRVGV
ncbi:hypothetical protein H7X46_22135 [Pseudonocardia sp. C8]|uniref:thiolase family protein n=1 Tax=Pseudonocardia sp. C8 TaxID=2762759 RepID=UPI0016424792|nr:hypothetical protein [Pseudonocardia sp. C8]MBC3193763.1 hypothetical protein [Pseudonocardia sp. C8]